MHSFVISWMLFLMRFLVTDVSGSSGGQFPLVYYYFSTPISYHFDKQALQKRYYH